MAGSLGMAAGEAIIAGMQHALISKTPFILFSASGGARMQEGILSLMQMPRTTIAVQQLREARLPYIVVLTHPTTGGVTASYAMLGDIQIAEPKALICFAGPRVIQQTIREQLPEGFQRSEYLLEHGMIDMVVHRHNLRETIARVCSVLTSKPRTKKSATTGKMNGARVNGAAVSDAGIEVVEQTDFFEEDGVVIEAEPVGSDERFTTTGRSTSGASRSSSTTSGKAPKSTD